MNPLEQLKDIHIPPQVSAWPPAYGWWLLAALLILLIIIAIVLCLKRRRFNAPKREALNALTQITSAQVDWPIRINTLLKRVCLHYLPSDQLAKLHSAQWQEYLTRQLPESKQASFKNAFNALQSQLYRPEGPKKEGFEQIHKQATLWLKHAKFKAEQDSSSTGAAHV